MSQDPAIDERTKLAASLTLLQDKVYKPTYFATLAELGFVPATEKEAEAYMRIGQRLLAEDMAENRKQAAAGENYVVAAANQLEQWLDGGQPASHDIDAHAVKQAAVAFGGDPEIVAAATLLQDAIAAAAR